MSWDSKASRLPLSSSLFLLYIYKWAYRGLFVCLSVGTCRVNGNPNPCTYRAEIFHTYPYLYMEGFDAGLTPAPGPGGPKTLKAEGHIFENH